MTSQTFTTLQASVLPPAPPTLTFNPGATVSASSATVLDPNASVAFNGTTAANIGAIQISLGKTGGKLGILNGSTLSAADTSVTVGNIVYTYSSTNQVLALVGNSNATDQEYTALLKKVAFDATGASLPTGQSISVNLGRPVYDAGNGHYYEFVPFQTGQALSWTASKAAAATSTLFGLSGYLATITNDAENTFLTNRFESKGWVSGIATTNGNTRTWTWDAGPELGKSFWIGNTAASGGTSTGTDRPYANWAPGEPNNYGAGGEPYAHLLTSGKWNDLANSPQTGQQTQFIPDGYWVEYSTTTGTGDDLLSGTRKSFNVTIDNPGINQQLDLVFYDATTGQVSFAFTDANFNVVKIGLDLSGDTPKLVNNANIGSSTAQGATWNLISAKVDVDKDGNNDIIVRNSTTGEVVFLFGEARTGTDRKYAYTRSASLEYAGRKMLSNTIWTVDLASNTLGSDGKSAMLWRNKSSGDVAVGNLVVSKDSTTGATRVTHQVPKFLYNVGANSGWRVVADGELNENVTTREIVWVDDLSGQTSYWSLNASRSDLASAKFFAYNVKEWTLSLVANLNGTGNDELVWQRGGDVAIWNIDNGLVTGGSLVKAKSSDRVRFASDVVKGGTLELVAQNDADGTVGVYGLSLIGSTYGQGSTRREYTAASSSYRPGKGTGGQGLELVNVAQYDTLSQVDLNKNA